MNVRAKTILSLSTALPLLALAAFLLIQPPAWAQSSSTSDAADPTAPVNCIYAGLSYSPGATIKAACPSGEAQTCLSDGTWTACQSVAVVVGGQ